MPDDGARLGRPRVWMVDPIDGTSDFILGEEGFVVMIGLAVDGRPTVGAVAHPLSAQGLRGRRRRGRLGRGGGRRAHAAAHVDPGSPARTSAWSRRRPTARAASTPSRSALQITDEMNVGSVGLKIGLVSEAAARSLRLHGRAHEDLGHLRAGGDPRCGAGGRMTDVDGNPLVYDLPDLYNRRGIVASNGPLHDFVIATLAPLVRTTD